MKKGGIFSPERREILKRLLEKDGLATKQTGIPRWVGDRSRAPLSFAQHRLWLIDQMQAGSPAYNMPSAYRLSGALNLSALERSLNEVVQRHESLRTSFQRINEQPVQVVAPCPNFSLPIVDLQDLPKSEREQMALRLTTEEAQTPFDLATSPMLLRSRLLRLEPEEHILLLTMHHIISDGWSIGLLAREAITLYAAFCQEQPSPLSELPIQYVDFAAWQREWLQGQRLEKLQTYWQQSLSNMTILELPTDHPRPKMPSHHGATRSMRFSQAQTEKLRTFIHQTGISLFNVLLASFLVVLARYTGQTDISVRSPVANRTRQQTETLIGYFVNILALRTDLSGNPTFEELVKRVNNTCQAAFAHQDLPFEQVLDDLHPLRRSRGPLFPVMFILQNVSISIPNVPSGTFHPLTIENNLALFDLTISVAEAGSEIQADFNYNTDLFEAATIQTMMEDYRVVLESALLTPGQQLDTLGEKIPGEHIPPLRPESLHDQIVSERVAAMMPRNPVEETMAKVWQNVLGMEQVGIFDNFFELGGDSLQWMRIISGLNQMGLSLPPRQILQSQTIAELAEATTAAPIESDAPITGPVPLSPNQRWFFEQGFIAPHHFNSANFFEVEPSLKLNPSIAKEVLCHLILHHDALRLRFFEDGSDWKQQMTPPDDEIPFSVMDLSALPEPEQSQMMDVTASQAESTLNLSDGPLLRVILFDCGPHLPSYILFIIHHLLTDAFSNNILLQDFMTGYQQLAQGQPIRFPAKTTSFKHWNERLVEYAQSPEILQELEYWQAKPDQTLPGLPALHYPNAGVIFKSMYKIQGKLDIETTHTLQQKILKDYDVQLIEVMLAVMAETIGMEKVGRSLFVDILRHGRNLPLDGIDLSRTVGWCVLHYPLLLKLDHTQGLKETLRLVKEQYRRPINGGVGYDLLRYMNRNEEIRKTLLPRPVIVFSHESVQSTVVSAAVPQPLIRPVNRPILDYMDPNLVWPYLLELRTTVVEDQLHWVWTSGESIYQRAAVEEWSQNFGDILKKLCKS